MTYGEKLKVERESNGLTQAQLADAAGVSLAVIRNYEQGDRMPGFAIVTHVGRRSGKAYQTPVNAFRLPGGYRIALTYGAESDWVRNVLAAGGCELLARGRRVRLVRPELVNDPSLRWAPVVVRLILGRIKATQYLDLSFAAGA